MILLFQVMIRLADLNCGGTTNGGSAGGALPMEAPAVQLFLQIKRKPVGFSTLVEKPTGLSLLYKTTHRFQTALLALYRLPDLLPE